MSFIEDDISTKSGTVVSWHGSMSDIPSGWAICDGNNGTVDLRDSYERAQTNYQDGSGNTVTNDSITLSQSQIASHDHSPVSVQNGGGHNHSVAAIDGAYIGDTNTYAHDSGGGGISSTSAGSHSHSGGSLAQAGSGNSISTDPSYYEVIFIQRL